MCMHTCPRPMTGVITTRFAQRVLSTSFLPIRNAIFSDASTHQFMALWHSQETSQQVFKCREHGREGLLPHAGVARDDDILQGNLRSALVS